MSKWSQIVLIAGTIAWLWTVQSRMEEMCNHLSTIESSAQVTNQHLIAIEGALP